MAPVLLDQRSLFKAGITLTLAMCVVFSSGYYVGFQKAVTGNSMEFNTTMALALPKPAHADTAEYEPYTPEQQLPGAYIDVDSPDPAVSDAGGNTRAGDQDDNNAGDVESVIEQTTSHIEEAAVSDAATMHKDHQLQLASLPVGSENAGVVAADDKHTAATGSENNPVLSANRAEDARYTIQVGVFADAENALRRKTELESQQLEAYISEYKNKRDELRFNVRFGYFKHKSSAVEALTRFEQNMSGSGYVTRIRDN
jgi:cell division septation protein DedD